MKIICIIYVVIVVITYLEVVKKSHCMKLEWKNLGLIQEFRKVRMQQLLFLLAIFLTQLRHQSNVSSASLNSTSIENSVCFYVSSGFGYILSPKILILLA